MYILLDSVGKQLTLDCMNRMPACGLMTFIILVSMDVLKKTRVQRVKKTVFIFLI